MKVCFTQDHQHVAFVHESGEEYVALKKFPGFQKLGMYESAPATLPIVYSLLARLQALAGKGSAIKTLNVDPAVREWVNQPFKLKPLPSDFYYHTTPKDFQDIALRYLYTLGSAGLLLDPGMGKSKVVLDYIFLMKFKKVCVVAPMALLFVWEDEIRTHRPELTKYVVRTTDPEVEQVGVDGAQVVIINYTKATMMKSWLEKQGFEFLHLDEFLIKDPATARSQSLTALSKSIPYRCGGSGTLVNNTPLDMFSPVKFLQPALVGWSFTTFKDRYSIEKGSKSDPKRKVIVGYRDLPEIRSLLESCCIVMTKAQWLKLPEKVFKDIVVQMAPDQKAAYNDLLSNKRLDVAGYEVLADNPLVAMSKLDQISNGFIYLNEEKPADVAEELLASEKAARRKPKKRIGTFFFEDQPKIEALRTLLTETLPGSRRAIIWFNLSGEAELIKTLLDELGHSYLTIQGGEKDIGGKVHRFNRDQSVRWLLCQAKSVNYGITVMGAKAETLEEDGVEILPSIDTRIYTEIFYSISFSSEVYQQQQDRVHRLGQEHVCEYYRIFVNSSVEKRKRQAIEDKLELRADMLVDVAHTLLKETSQDVQET